jgi:predicted metal-binding membrane protein
VAAGRNARKNDIGLLLVLGAGAWVAVVAVARHMGAMPGTMGLGIAAFVALWLLMMAAMMMPGVTPFASFYTRTFTRRRQARLLAFVSGYLLVWTLAALPAYGLARAADALVADHRGPATVLAAAVFVLCGAYQLSPLKDRCLALCRSPLAFVARYGQSSDFVVGARHGAFCLGCCWTLMALLVAFGLMNVVAMVAVAAIVLVEKAWARGVGFARIVGVLSFALALAVIARPSIAGGLYQSNATSMMGAM